MSFYALIATLVSFIILIIYYSIAKPDYLVENKIGEETEISLRLLVVYSLLFSSALGLVVLMANTGYVYYTTKKNEKNE